MNRSELVRQVAVQTGLDPAAADAAVKAALGAVAGALARGETVRLVGFGAFGVRSRPARTARNPATGAYGAQSRDRREHRRAGVAVGVVPGRQGGLRDAANRTAG